MRSRSPRMWRACSGSRLALPGFLVEHFETRNVTKHPPSIGNMPLLLARTAAAVGETQRAAEFVSRVYPRFGFEYIDTLAEAARAVLAHADGDPRARSRIGELGCRAVG